MNGTNFNNGVLKRMLGSDGSELPSDVARFFLNLSLNAADEERIHVLSEKANEGDLTSQERDELALYVVFCDFLAIMQSRARISLKDKSPAA